MTIQNKVTELLSIRSQIDEMKKAVEPLMAQRDALQKNIIEHMKKMGFSSVKTDEAMVSKQTSKRLVIVDEKLVIDQLKEKGLTDYVIETINKDLWQPFSKEALKQGMLLNGTEITETEYISIRKTKGGEEE